MQGFKLIIKVLAKGLGNSTLEDKVEKLLNDNGIQVQAIKSKGTVVMGIIDPIAILNNTVDRKTSQLYEANRQTRNAEHREGKLQDELERIKSAYLNNVGVSYCDDCKGNIIDGCRTCN